MKINNQSGFTLIEVLIALFLLVIGILGALTMQIASIRGNSLASRLTEASIWAGHTSETLMALPYTSVVTDPLLLDDGSGGAGLVGLNDTDIPGSLADGGPVTKENYTVFWNVADDYPIDNCKTINVIVRYNVNGVIKTVAQTFSRMRKI